jgi:hypothetical protein
MESQGGGVQPSSAVRGLARASSQLPESALVEIPGLPRKSPAGPYTARISSLPVPGGVDRQRLNGQGRFGELRHGRE